MKKLSGKTAVVTGGARGIGLCIAKLFASEGASVICVDTIDPETPLNNVDFHKLDVTDRTACKEFYENTIDKKSIDILVNNAGITRDAMTRKMTDEQWDAVINVNLNGVFNLTRYIGPHMNEKKSGSIINISSVTGEAGNIGQANYSATKSALIGLTKTWAKEFALKGALVRVNAISPGFIETEMVKTIPEGTKNKIIETIVLKKLGQPEDVAKAALFLASDDSGFITGQNLSVNGGMYM